MVVRLHGTAPFASASGAVLLPTDTLVRPPKEGAEMADNIAQDVLDADRRRKAVLLRVKGAHWSEIRDACNYPSATAALADVGHAMAEATRRAEETADMMRDTANLRLESLLKSTLDMLDETAPETYDNEGNPLGPGDDRAVRLRAVDEARRLVGDITKLNGVDKPSKDESVDDVQTIRIVGVDPSSII